MILRRLTLLASLGLFAALTLVLAGVIPAVRFVRERIELTVRPRSLEVNGLYVYANPLPILLAQGLTIPFPTDATQLAPATIAVTEVDPATGTDLRPIPVLWFLNERSFTIRVPAAGETWVRVRFTQRATAGTATYLLTTTKPWGRPLERGLYVLRPEDAIVERQLKDLVAYQLATGKAHKDAAGNPQYEPPHASTGGTRLEFDHAEFYELHTRSLENTFGRAYETELRLGPDRHTFQVWASPRRFPPFPNNHLVWLPAFYADQTGRIRAIRVHERDARCPEDAPICHEVGADEIQKMAERLEQ